MKLDILQEWLNILEGLALNFIYTVWHESDLNRNIWKKLNLFVQYAVAFGLFEK